MFTTVFIASLNFSCKRSLIMVEHLFFKINLAPNKRKYLCNCFVYFEFLMCCISTKHSAFKFLILFYMLIIRSICFDFFF